MILNTAHYTSIVYNSHAAVQLVCYFNIFIDQLISFKIAAILFSLLLELSLKCPTQVPSFDWLRHCVQLCRTLNEDSMVNTEVTVGTDICTIDACTWPKADPDDAINIIERFSYLCLTETAPAQIKVDHARRKLFPRKKKSRLPELL